MAKIDMALMIIKNQMNNLIYNEYDQLTKNFSDDDIYNTEKFTMAVIEKILNKVKLTSDLLEDLRTL